MHHESSSKHRFADDDDQLFYRETRKMIATLHTTSTKYEQMLRQSIDEGEEDEELVEMTHSRDALGWKKVFVDMRGEIPSGRSLPTIGLTTWMPNVLSIPRPSLLLRSGSSSAAMDIIFSGIFLQNNNQGDQVFLRQHRVLWSQKKLSKCTVSQSLELISSCPLHII